MFDQVVVQIPAPAAAYHLTHMARVKELPLYLAYGAQWLTRINDRARQYREPHDERYDFDVKDVSQSLEVIRTCQ
jgi:hypothetical protein